MAYTVKKVAAMSGVSVRTLHFYYDVGLLKPTFPDRWTRPCFGDKSPKRPKR